MTERELSGQMLSVRDCLTLLDWIHEKHLKGIVHPKNENLLKMWDECFFIRFGEMWLSNGSEWVPSERESDKNITIIHSPSVNIWIAFN